ncbi:MAG: hypothetical protein ACOC7K_02395, partial [bacterium]
MTSTKLRMYILPVVAISLLFATGFARWRTEGEVSLEGARPIIEARHFPSIQAALDAVPDGGGLVQLPPGKFKIDEPLVLRRGETHLEGAGAATHIVNVNQDGKPALILQHADGEKVKRDDHLWRVSLEKFRLTGNAKSGHGIVA